MKLAIVGGSAASTPALFATPEFLAMAHQLDVTLIGRSRDRLGAVSRAIEVLTDGTTSPQCTTDLDDVRDAELVILQARYGGYEGRARDELFPLRHNLCGDEGLGPGGLAAAWRSWPQLAGTLDAVARRSPHATILLMTAPLGLLVRCANAAFPALDIVGICELPWSTLRSVCSELGVPAERVRFGYAGVNHLGWFDRLQADGADLISRYAATREGAGFPSKELISSIQAVPLKYLRMHYEPAEALLRARAAPARADELRLIALDAMRCFASARRDEIVAALKRRPTPWYADAVAPFVAAAAGHATSTVFFLSAPNEGYLPFVSADDTIEQPFAIQNGARRRLLREEKFPPALADTLERYVEYERCAARAVLANQVSECATVLAKHPWVAGRSELDSLAADVIAAI